MPILTAGRRPRKRVAAAQPNSPELGDSERGNSEPGKVEARPAADRVVSFGDVLRVRQFRALWLAEAQSSIGDQLARLSITVLVFAKTGSATISALFYALTFLPALLGGALLAGLADWFPRRELMICCDLLRFATVAVMAIPALPLPVLAVLLVGVVLVNSPFTAAQSAIVPDLLSDEAYTVGTGLRGVTDQLAQLLGFGVGGVVIAVLGVRGCLLLDALTFGLSALLLTFGLRATPRQRSTRPDEDEPGYFAAMRSGLGFVFSDGRLRTLLGLVWLSAFFVVPEGLAPAYVASLHGSTAEVGVLMAADPAGFALGTFLFLRLRTDRIRQGLVGPMAMAAGVPLIACSLHPGLAISAGLWALCGLFSAYQSQVTTDFVRLVPPSQRGKAIGFGSSGLIAVQGLGIAAAGLLSSATSPSASVAMAGTGATALAFGLGLRWSSIQSIGAHRAR